MRTFTFLLFIAFLFVAQSARAVSLGISPSAQVTQNGQALTVNVTATGYTDVVAYQFSMNWDPAVIQLQGLSNFMSDLNVSNFNLLNAGSGVLTVVYYSATTQPTSLPDGSTIFSLQFLAIGANGTSSNITFGSAPTPLKFYNSALVSLGVTTQSGLVTIDAQAGFSASGNIHRFSAPPVPGATVDMTGDALGTDVTGMPGDYLLQNILAGSDVTLTPSKDVDHLECVSVRDIILIYKHILGLMPLPNPYQMIEADVNKSNTITTFDAVEIRKLILGIYTQFPNNTSWRFVPEDFVFPNPSNPFQNAFPEQANITNVQADVVKNFIGMKVGDASDCVNDAPAPAFLTLSASNASGTTGQQVSIDVSVQGFNNVLGLQFSMQWDPAVLQFDQVNNLNLNGLALNHLNTATANGKLSFCWNNDVLLGGHTLPDGTKIFSLQFTIVGVGGGVTPISFVQTPTKFEVVDGACLPYTLNVNNGNVQWSGGGGGALQLTASNATACPGDVVCVDVSVADFDNIISGQFTLDWDPVVISFQNLQNLNAALGLNNSNFSTSFTASGHLLFSWFDPNALGVTLPDNSVLFQICFAITGPSGSSSSVDFSSSPVVLEFVNEPGGPVAVATTNGSVTANPITDVIVCNDLVILSPNTDCGAIVSVDGLLESCAGDVTIGIFESLSDPPILSGGNSITFDASPYVGQLLFFKVTSTVSGNSCWGNILINDNCPPGATLCDSITTAIHDDTSSTGCCHILHIQNQKPNYFTYIAVSVLGGGELEQVPSANAGWSWQGTVGNTAYFAPNAGTAPVGDYDVADFCLKNLSADAQTVEIQYYDINFEIVCRDTFSLRCDACVQAVVDSVYCEGWGRYIVNLCIQAGETLENVASSATLVPLGGAQFSVDAPNINNADGSVVVSLPDLHPGNSSCNIVVHIGGATAGQTVCFYAIIHDGDIPAGEPDGFCCADTVPVCVPLPNCDPCDSTVTYATAMQVDSPTDSCCWKITLHNPPDAFVAVGTQIITPGVAFGAINNFPPTSGWFINSSTLTNVWWTPFPAGMTVPGGSMLPTVCFDVSSTSSSPQEVLISWMTEDSMYCYDVLQFDCLPDDFECASLDSTHLVCNQDGTFTFTFTVKNYSSITADHIHLTPAGSLPFTVNPAEFYLTLPPGATSPPLTTTITGSTTGGVFNLLVSLHEINDDSLHVNCCTTDTIPVKVDDDLGPTCESPPNVTVECANFDPSLHYGAATGADECCLDTIITSANYALFDSLCAKGTIVKTFTALDCAGNTAVCQQNITVLYEENYYVKFPDDLFLTTCDGDNDFGTPEIYGQDCELIGIGYEDFVVTIVPDACYKIERTWTIINWCTYDPSLPCTVVPNPNPSPILNHPTNLPGPVVSEFGNTVSGWAPTVVAVSPGASPTDYSTFWSANANCYKYTQIIKVIDSDPPQVNCPASPVEICDYSDNDAALWNEPYWTDPMLGTNDLCEGAANLELTATDLCYNPGGLTFAYLLFLDLDGDGTMETVVNSANLPGYNNVQFGNAGNSGYSGGTSRAFDERLVPANQKWGFGLQVDGPAGASQTARVRWFNQIGQNTAPQLPYGTHKIKWTVMDACGNETVCEYLFTVKDCGVPQISCIGGLSATLMPVGMVVLWATDFIQSAQDNCTPSPMLTFGIRILGTGSGFPTGQVNQIFTCAEVGTQQVEVWVMDKAGNTNFCQTFVNIQDNFGICPSPAPNGGDAFRLYQNQPNPWSENTVIGFYLPEASTATLTVFDVTGRPRYTTSGAFPKGNNSFQLERGVTEEGGMLYYRVRTPAASATMKMAQER